MVARRPFCKWHRWKLLGFCPYPQTTCIRNLELKFQSKLELRSGNHVAYRRTDRQTDRQTDGQGESSITHPHPPPATNFVRRGYKKPSNTFQFTSKYENIPPWWRQMEAFFAWYWPFVPGIHRSPVNSPHKDQWRGALVFSLICAWIISWVNNREAGDLRRYLAHCDVSVSIYLVVYSLHHNVVPTLQSIPLTTNGLLYPITQDSSCHGQHTMPRNPWSFPMTSSAYLCFAWMCVCCSGRKCA